MSKEVESSSIKRWVLQWLKEPGNLCIAQYQRAYSWPESFITNFIKTILAAIDPNNTNGGPADLGAVVLEVYEAKDGAPIEYIADGQQRILTFALLAVAVLGEDAFTDGESSDCRSRIRSLLGASSRPSVGQCSAECGGVCSECGSSFCDLETLVRADEAYRIIRKVLDRELLDLGVIRKNLKLVTCGIDKIEVNAEHAQADRSIVRLFEAINTTAKPLNGGQILKARHYGAIAEPEVLNKLESWWLDEKDESPSDKRRDALAFSAARVPVTKDEFVDAPNQEAWYAPGQGFVQSVQGILLGQDNWWSELNLQGAERMDPFDRMQGTQQNQPEVSVGDQSDVVKTLEHYGWRADDPLVFAKGWGFFAMVNRLNDLFADLCRGLHSTKDQKSSRLDDDVDLDLAETNRVTQAFCRGLLDAIRTMHQVKKRIEKFKQLDDKSVYKSKVIDAISRGKTNPDGETDSIDQTLGQMEEIKYWLGLNDGQQRAMHSSGCMLVVVFSILLCWADRFEGKALGNGQSLRSSDADQLDHLDDTLRQLALWLFLAARFDCYCRYASVLGRLHAAQAVGAAHFSHDLDNAWWRFMKLVRQDYGVKYFFIGLREFFNEYEGDEAPKALNSLIASYLD